MAGTRNDPLKSFSFLVEIDGIPSASFQSVSGLAAEAEVIEYREGADKLTSSRKLPGRVEYPNVTLTRGLTTSRDLWEWWLTVRDGNLQRRTVLNRKTSRYKYRLLKVFSAPKLDNTADSQLSQVDLFRKPPGGITGTLHE